MGYSRCRHMMRSGIALLFAHGMLFLVGCGTSDDDSTPANGGGTSALSGGVAGTTQAGANGGTPNAGASGGSSGNATSGGSGAGGAPASEMPTSPAGVVIEQSVELGEPGLKLLNSNLEQWVGNTTLAEWFGEVRNDGTTIACSVRAEVAFLDVSDTAVWGTGRRAQLYSTPYVFPEQPNVVEHCLAPGETGVLLIEDQRNEPVLLDAITHAVATLYSVSNADAVPHPDAPTLTNVVLMADGNGYWHASGDLTALVNIRVPDLRIFLRNSPTSFYDGQREIHSSNGVSVAAGETWHFETSARPDEVYSELTELTPFVDNWLYPQ